MPIRQYEIQTDLLQRLCAARKWSAEELAHQSGVDLLTIRQIQSGKTAYLLEIVKIAKALHLYFDQLIAADVLDQDVQSSPYPPRHVGLTFGYWNAQPPSKQGLVKMLDELAKAVPWKDRVEPVFFEIEKRRVMVALSSRDAIRTVNDYYAGMICDDEPDYILMPPMWVLPRRLLFSLHVFSKFIRPSALFNGVAAALIWLPPLFASIHTGSLRIPSERVAERLGPLWWIAALTPIVMIGVVQGRRNLEFRRRGSLFMLSRRRRFVRSLGVAVDKSEHAWGLTLSSIPEDQSFEDERFGRIEAA